MHLSGQDAAKGAPWGGDAGPLLRAPCSSVITFPRLPREPVLFARSKIGVNLPPGKGRGLCSLWGTCGFAKSNLIKTQGLPGGNSDYATPREHKQSPQRRTLHCSLQLEPLGPFDGKVPVCEYEFSPSSPRGLIDG